MFPKHYVPLRDVHLLEGHIVLRHALGKGAELQTGPLKPRHVHPSSRECCKWDAGRKSLSRESRSNLYVLRLSQDASAALPHLRGRSRASGSGYQQRPQTDTLVESRGTPAVARARDTAPERDLATRIRGAPLTVTKSPSPPSSTLVIASKATHLDL